MEDKYCIPRGSSLGQSDLDTGIIEPIYHLKLPECLGLEVYKLWECLDLEIRQ